MALNRVRTAERSVTIRHALISVSDKRGLDVLVHDLVESSPDIRIFSTGGTWQAIRDILGSAHRERLEEVSAYTGQPELQGGLVKTLDFKIYLGLLSESDNPDHRKDMNRIGAVPIDLVAVNLYPFSRTIARPDSDLEDARANVDIGGPCMLRAAAKNWLRVTVLSNPDDYAGIGRELKEHSGAVSYTTRFRCAQAAFRHTAAYDAAIAEYLSSVTEQDAERTYELQERRT